MMAIELAVCLRARPLDSRPLGTVEHAELDTRPVDHASHQAIERIDLSDEMPFAEAANRGITRHLADRLEFMRNERSTRAHTGSSRGRLAAGVPASHNNNVENSCAHASNSSCWARHNRLAGAKEVRVPPPEVEHANVTNVGHNGCLGEQHQIC